jgi:hypothetical protein
MRALQDAPSHHPSLPLDQGAGPTRTFPNPRFKREFVMQRVRRHKMSWALFRRAFDCTSSNPNTPPRDRCW